MTPLDCQAAALQMRLGRWCKAQLSSDPESILFGVRPFIRNWSTWALGLTRKIKEVCVGQRFLLLIPDTRIQRMCLPLRLRFYNPL